MEIDVRCAADRADEELSLELFNAVWPQHAVTMAEVDSFKRAALAHADYVAVLDGEPAGSGFVAILPQERLAISDEDVAGAFRRIVWATVVTVGSSSAKRPRVRRRVRAFGRRTPGSGPAS